MLIAFLFLTSQLPARSQTFSKRLRLYPWATKRPSINPVLGSTVSFPLALATHAFCAFRTRKLHLVVPFWLFLCNFSWFRRVAGKGEVRSNPSKPCWLQA